MKNQYFGDENDYCKYGLLRALARAGIAAHVAWMLTEDGGTHGVHTGYLKQPGSWRHYDPDLFDFLRGVIESGTKRSLRLIETTGFIPGASFTSDVAPGDCDEQGSYFRNIVAAAMGKQLIYLDPDTGIAAGSVRLDKLKAYVRLEEIQRLNLAGFTLLIYQHLPRVLPPSERAGYIKTGRKSCSDARTPRTSLPSRQTASSSCLFAVRNMPLRTQRGMSNTDGLRECRSVATRASDSLGSGYHLTPSVIRPVPPSSSLPLEKSRTPSKTAPSTCGVLNVMQFGGYMDFKHTVGAILLACIAGVAPVRGQGLPAERSAYEHAKQIDTAEAYSAYIRHFPRGYYADLARAALRKLDEPGSASSGALSHWNHNGSVMVLTARGHDWEMRYEAPRQGMLEAGAEPGSMLFTGWAEGGEISGTAYIFSPSCGIQPYQVSGYVERDGRRVVMRGQAPRVSRADCKIFGTKEDELVFERIN